MRCNSSASSSPFCSARTTLVRIFSNETTKPGSATLPFPGVKAAILDDDGNEVKPPDGPLSSFVRVRGSWIPRKLFVVGGTALCSALRMLYLT